MRRHWSPQEVEVFWKTAGLVFVTVFLAEIGDKTQLATMLFSARGDGSKWAFFLGSASALVLAAGIGVLIGAVMERYVSPQTLKIVAGLGFIGVGLWTLFSK
jgi:putative Ca2+/H+ antiporter (TMEM165/GDT1 family)